MQRVDCPNQDIESELHEWEQYRKENDESNWKIELTKPQWIVDAYQDMYSNPPLIKFGSDD